MPLSVEDAFPSSASDVTAAVSAVAGVTLGRMRMVRGAIRAILRACWIRF